MQHEQARITLPDEVVMNKIYLIRGQKVMLDRDLAELYGVETKVLKQAVKRNIDRFPEDFMFQLTEDEEKVLRSKFVTLKRGQHSKYAPFVFTEQGVTMLSCLLNSPTAIRVNIQIIRIFTRMRELLLTHKDILMKLEQLEKEVSKNSKGIQQIFDVLKHLLNHPEKERTEIWFKQKKK